MNRYKFKRYSCDVLVVGGGGAGLRAAIASKEFNPEGRVILVTKGKLPKSGVTATACSDRMAFQATLPYTQPGGEEAWRYHADDIYRLGGYVSDRDLAEILAKNSHDALTYLDKLGVPFIRKDGRIDQFMTDGSSYARACYTGPNTAIDIEQALIKRLRRLDIQVIEEHMIVDLITSQDNEGRKGNNGEKRNKRVVGAAGLFMGEQLFSIFEAGAVILATGGAGECYRVNVFPPGMTGDGYALAYRVGAELVNMEFIQIGLCSVMTKLACSGSMMRAIPSVVNDKGEEFLGRYFPQRAPSPNVICNNIFAKGASWPVSYESSAKIIDIAVFKEIARGRKVYLDYSWNPVGFDYNQLSIEVKSWYDSRIDYSQYADFEKNRNKSPFYRLKLLNPGIINWLGHRGIDLLAGDKEDVFGRPINEGDMIIWDRGHVCGHCPYCTVKDQPYLCLYREVYGITEDGCHTTHLILKAGTRIIKVDQDIKPELLVPAGCFGATAAHAVEMAGIKPGDTVVIYGPGPLGIFAVALSSRQGASNIIVIGTRRSRWRLDLTKEFGATDIMTIDETNLKERIAFIKSRTHSLGASVVIDCAGTKESIEEGVKVLMRGGSYLLPGLAAPLGKIGIDFYHHVVRANIRIQGVWVSDTSHLHQAVQLILAGRYPFEKLITHVFSLKEVDRAMQAVASRQALKAVLKP